MNKLTHWIKGHQIAAFFIITSAITWGLGFSYGAAQTKGILWLYPVASLATCGPALAGIIITALTNTQLGIMALFLMAVSGTGGHDLEFLDCQFLPDHPFLDHYGLVLQPQ